MKSYFLQAIRGITHNKSRTFLTTLGIMIGIGTVVLVLSAGEGFKSYINSQVEVFGSNTVYVEVRIPPSTKSRADSNGGIGDHLSGSSANSAVPITTLKNKDIEDVKTLPNVTNAYGAVFGQQIASYNGVSKNALIFGADASRFDIDKGELASGRPYTLEEDRSLAQIAILGNKIAEDLFGNEDPLEKYIRVGNYNLQVIGVYEKRGGLGATDDQQIFIPLSTLQKKYLGIDYLYYGVIQLVDINKDEITALDIADMIRHNHSITDPAKDDFSIMTQAQTMDMFNVILNAVTFLLIAIALISLIVGGVGVMNIMYVVITERIGEIGLKKALGARNKDILYEFLIEAVLLTLIGGVVGLIGGAFFSYMIAKVAQSFDFDWDFIIPISGIILSVSISMMIGVVFGVFPARRASKLNPIEALNKE
jgi:ABC-type antimicrobial peptide transport system permease subunit